MSKYSGKDTSIPVSNKEVAAAFRAAIRYLALDGYYTSSSGGYTFICWAIQEAERRKKISLEQSYAAIHIIMERLEGRPTLTAWLIQNCRISRKDAYAEGGRVLQKHRHDWLWLLVKEFRNKPEP